MAILVLVVLFAFCSSLAPPKCIATAPYNLNRLDNQLAIDKVVREAQGWYEERLAYMAENPPQTQAAMDYFMQVFCPDPYFKGFVGITLDGHVYTNRTEVSELYRTNFLVIGTGVMFNVKFHSERIDIDHSLSTRQVVYANITAFNEHLIRAVDSSGVDNFYIGNGHYVNQWRIDSQGNACLSRFTDTFLKYFRMEHTTLLNIPSDLQY